jgi:hypothetical protein
MIVREITAHVALDRAEWRKMIFVGNPNQMGLKLS